MWRLLWRQPRKETPFKTSAMVVVSRPRRPVRLPGPLRRPSSGALTAPAAARFADERAGALHAPAHAHAARLPAPLCLAPVPPCLPPRARLAPAWRPPHPSPSLASCPHRSCPPAPLPPSPTARHHHTPPSPPPPLPHPRSSQVWLAHTGELLPAVGIATANVVRAASRCRAALTELSKELMLNAHPPSILGQFLSRFLGNS